MSSFISFFLCVVFYKNILRTSAASSTNFGSIYSSLQAALLVLVIYYVGESFLNGRGPILLFQKNVHLFCFSPP